MYVIVYILIMAKYQVCILFSENIDRMLAELGVYRPGVRRIAIWFAVGNVKRETLISIADVSFGVR